MRDTSKRSALGRALFAASLTLLGCWLFASLIPKTSWFRDWVVAKESSLAALGDPEIEGAPSMVWAHRGLRGPAAPPNTEAAMRAAAEAGFPGVEMDLRWRDGALIVAHDADEQGLPFGEVISGVGPRQYVWLDFKALSASVARQCSAALLRELPEALRTRTFIESNDLDGLAILRAAVPGTRAIYTTSPWHWPRFSLGYASLLYAAEKHGLSVLGIPARELTPEVATALRGIGLFTWTTNDPDDLARQRALDVDVILTDRLQAPL